MDKGKLAQAVKNLKSDDDETRKEARKFLLEASLQKDGIAALQHKHYKALEDCLETPDRQLAATCLSRILCSNLNNQKKVEWDRVSLEDLRKSFVKSNRRDAKEKMLKAVRLFVLVEDQGQDKFRLLEETDWMKSALSPSTDLYLAAILLLDALQRHERLPGAIIKSAHSAAMLAYGIRTFVEEPERLAALRVASCVMLSLEEGSSGASLHEEQEWLRMLHQAGVVKGLVSCIDGDFKGTLEDRALPILTQLSAYNSFAQEIAQGEVVCILVAKALAKKRFDTILVLMRQPLTSRKVVAALSDLESTSGVDFAEECFAALKEADAEAAVSGLAFLKAWAQCNPQSLADRDVEFSRLANFLCVPDLDV